MSCPEYEELQSRCEFRRKEMGHLMLNKPRNWQSNSTLRNFAKETQAAILKATTEITKHQRTCVVCNQDREETWATRFVL
jgi:hypothetical protein